MALPAAADAVLAYGAGFALVVLPWSVVWLAGVAARMLRHIE